MNNNDTLKKLRVALQLRDDDFVKILALVDFKITKSEINALFRNEDHTNFKPCGDQILRNFLNGLIIFKRGIKPQPESKKSTLKKSSPLREKNDSPKKINFKR